MSEQKTIAQLETEVLAVIKTIYDPEIPVNIYDLGLIYRIEISDDRKLEIDMTLTAPNCPIADSLIEEVRSKTADITGIESAEVFLVFDPPWDKDRMSQEAMLELGFL
jgi:FeS assembly SUF system protein